MIQFRISTIFLLLTTIAVTTGWFVERRHLQHQLRKRTSAISLFGEKHDLWSPHGYIHEDISTLEGRLSDYVTTFDGPFVTSSQGLGSPRLRQPTLATLDAVIALLDSDLEPVRFNACQLLALYLQAFSGSKNLNAYCLKARIHFQLHGTARTSELLHDPNDDVRRAAALVIGNTLNNQRTVDSLVDAFERENVGTVKLAMSWAHWKLHNNYDKASATTRRQASKIAN